MRREKFWWTFLVGGVVCFIYGGFTLIYHFSHDNGLSIHALILLILGALALIVYLAPFVLTKEDVEKDLEGLQTMRNLARNVAFLVKAIRTQKEKEGLPLVEKEAFTSFPDGK